MLEDLTTAPIGEGRSVWPDELGFPPSEFLERIALVQSDLKNRGLRGALIFDPENMYWLTGLRIPANPATESGSNRPPIPA